MRSNDIVMKTHIVAVCVYTAVIEASHQHVCILILIIQWIEPIAALNTVVHTIHITFLHVILKISSLLPTQKIKKTITKTFLKRYFFPKNTLF